MVGLKLVVQIPAYNEEKSITNVIKEIPRKIKGIGKVEVLVIDDGSKDNTAESAKKAGADYVIRNNRNSGLGYSFRKGISKALENGADIIVNIDADGQFNSQEITLLIEPILRDQADMVTCTRFKDKVPENMPVLKKWGNKRFTNLISRITGQRFTDTQCGFRAYSKEAALRLNLFGKFTYTQEAFIDLARKGMRIREIPLKVVYHKNRESVISGNLSNYTFKSLGIIARTTRDSQPLTFFGVPGILIFILGVIGASYSFWFWLNYLVTTPVRQLFNVSVFFMIFGVSLIVLALLADMLKRISMTQEEILYKLKKFELENNVR